MEEFALEIFRIQVNTKQGILDIQGLPFWVEFLQPGGVCYVAAQTSVYHSAVHVNSIS